MCTFLATDGIGFREIYRPKIIDRPLENVNELPFDARLGRDITVDVSSLHVAVAEFNSLKQTRCNIHIDNLTVTLGGSGNDVGISPLEGSRESVKGVRPQGWGSRFRGISIQAFNARIKLACERADSDSLSLLARQLARRL